MADYALEVKLVDIGEEHPQHNMGKTKLIDAVDATVNPADDKDIVKVEDLLAHAHIVNVAVEGVGATQLLQGAQRGEARGLIASDRTFGPDDKKPKTPETKAVAVPEENAKASMPLTSTGEVGEVKLEPQDAPEIKTVTADKVTPEDQQPKVSAPSK